MALSSRQFHGGRETARIDAVLLEEHDFLHLLGLDLERAKRGGHPLSVLVGHVESASNGDGTPKAGAELEVLAGVLAEQKRQIDTAGLLNGDRFALSLPDTDEYGAMMAGERIHGALIERVGGEAARPDFGISAFPRHGRTPENLLLAAGRGLTAAQTLSRQRSITFDDRALVLTTTPAKRTGEPGERLQALLALAETVDVRDHLAPGHAQLVGRYAELIAREFSFSDSDIRLIRLAGVLHDVGKFVVPKAVFQKAGALSESEWEIVKRHPDVGARLLAEAELDEVAEWVRDHHEQPDGNGYPRGLKAGETSLESRMLAVADAYEAMTTRRSHRDARSHSFAREELTRCAGTQFDRRVVQAFLRQLERQCLISI